MSNHLAVFCHFVVCFVTRWCFHQRLVFEIAKNPINPSTSVWKITKFSKISPRFTHLLQFDRFRMAKPLKIGKCYFWPNWGYVWQCCEFLVFRVLTPFLYFKDQPWRPKEIIWSPMGISTRTGKDLWRLGSTSLLVKFAASRTVSRRLEQSLLGLQLDCWDLL